MTQCCKTVMYNLHSITAKLKLSCKRLSRMDTQDSPLDLLGIHIPSKASGPRKKVMLVGGDSDGLNNVALMEGKGINEERTNNIQREEDLRVGRKGVF